jgi:uncharacterized protein
MPRACTLVVTAAVLAAGCAGTPVNRRQNPEPPFPYRSIEVDFDNPLAEGVRLAGTLAVPQGNQPFPVVLLINGSGLQDRDGTMFGHRPFAVVADHLARRGIASLRVDDRSTGKSTGTIQNVTTLDFVSDAEAGVAFLKTRAEIDPHRISLVGHSEGGIIASLMAAKPKSGVASIIMLAATGLPGDRVFLEQQLAIARADGASEKELKSNSDLLETILQMAKVSQASREQLTKQLIAAARERQVRMSAQKLQEEMDRLASPWMRFFLNHNPSMTLARIECPVLALNGEKDLQVLPESNLTEIDRVLKQSGHRQSKAVRLPGLNHLFQTAQTGAPSEYEKIEESISPTVLEIISEWVLHIVEEH